MKEIVILSVVVVLIIVVIFLMKKSSISKTNYVMVGIDEKGTGISDDFMPETIVKFEPIPSIEVIDETKLYEIKDSRIWSHINNFAPEIVKSGILAGNAIKGSAGTLYRAVIPAGAKLTQSRDMSGAVRGIYHGAKGIKGHANLVEVDNATNTTVNAVASVMNVASLVVGQYYMSQINTELSEISDSISQIANFQNNEYKSKVFALVTQVQISATFKVEILENDELRLNEILKLSDYEKECCELLTQSNLMVSEWAKKVDLDFEAYEKELIEIQNWYIYQKTLLDVLYKIAKLKYALHRGDASREQCNALLPVYTQQVNAVRTQMTEWHDMYASKFGIDIENSNRKRKGIDGIIHKPLGLIKEEFNYRSISEKTSELITDQSSMYENLREVEIEDLYSKDVEIIFKDGKMFYLPEGREV